MVASGAQKAHRWLLQGCVPTQQCQGVQALEGWKPWPLLGTFPVAQVFWARWTSAFFFFFNTLSLPDSLLKMLSSHN